MTFKKNIYFVQNDMLKKDDVLQLKNSRKQGVTVTKISSIKKEKKSMAFIDVTKTTERLKTKLF